MKTSLLLAALLLSPVLTWAEDAPAPAPAPPAPDGASEARPRGAALRKQVLEKFDGDKDGKLSDAEREAARAAWKDTGSELHAKVLEKFDADENGKLSDPEREALKTAMKNRRNGRGDANKKREGKAGERHRKMLERFDEDKDGLLNESERAKAREARKASPADKP